MMEMTIGMQLIGWCVFVVKIVLICFLEWKLAQKREWYLGLILPFIYLWGSIPEILRSPAGERLMMFFGHNIETILLLMLFGIQRTWAKQKREYEAMRMKDL